MSTRPQAAGFRAEISALRACAVLLVVLYHLWPGRLPGGFVGVDVFFVISGFLITAHLFRETATTNTIDLPKFWARRARRLLPAAYLVLATTSVAVAIWLPVMSWANNFKQIIASTLYVQNWVLAADSVDYLAADGAPTAAQHYWTLSIEEQFYLAWPLLILAAIMISRRFDVSRRLTMVLVIGAPTIASFIYSTWLTEANPAAAYFVTPGRAWQFGVGGLLALLLAIRERDEKPAPHPVVSAVVSWSGFAALAYCGFMFDGSTPFPGTAALLPVGATLAIIWAGEPRWRLSPAPLMRWRPVTFLGDISYSMYLWHWPPIVIVPVILGRDMGFTPRLLILVGTIAAAWATKRWVEDPVRFTRRFGLRRPVITLVVTAVAAGAIVSGSSIGRGSAQAAEGDAIAAAQALVQDAPRCFGAASMDPDQPCDNPALDGTLVPSPDAVSQDYPTYPDCFTEPAATNLNDCTFGDTTDRSIPHVVLVGDSHARAMLPALVRMADQKRISLSAQLKSSCSWTRHPSAHPEKVRVTSCQTWKAKLEPWLLEQAPTTDLILTTGYAKINGGSHAEQVSSMKAAWAPLIKRGVPIMAMRDNPRHDKAPNDCLARLDTVTPDSCATTRKTGFDYFDAFAATGKAVKGATVLDMTDYYCTANTCPSVIGGVNVYRDNTHLTVTYVKTLTPYLYREMLAIGALPPPG